MAVSKKIVLHFPKRIVERAIVCRLAKDYDLEFNILKALVTPEEEGIAGTGTERRAGRV